MLGALCARRWLWGVGGRGRRGRLRASHWPPHAHTLGLSSKEGANEVGWSDRASDVELAEFRAVVGHQLAHQGVIRRGKTDSEDLIGRGASRLGRSCHEHENKRSLLAFNKNDNRQSLSFSLPGTLLRGSEGRKPRRIVVEET